jgi:hypothetical protein
MLIALIPLHESGSPYCYCSGLIESETLPPADVVPPYAEWETAGSKLGFTEWLVANHGCCKVTCGYALLGLGDDETGRV